jgi:hypothetical protein
MRKILVPILFLNNILDKSLPEFKDFAINVEE